jgi:BNR repeat-like domain
MHPVPAGRLAHLPGGERPRPVEAARHGVVYRDPFAYCAHPHIARLSGGAWLLVFNRSVRRSFILHPPQDPHFHNVTMRSDDEGQTWTAPQVAPGYDWHGVECAGLTALGSGIVLLHQRRFRWYPLAAAHQRPDASDLIFPRELAAGLVASPELDAPAGVAASPDAMLPWARGNGGTFVHRSHDGGRTWAETHEIETRPYPGGYGLRGAVEQPGGPLLLPLSDVPEYRRVFAVRSVDGGRRWTPPTPVAAEDGRWFEEPAALILPSGRTLVLLRENHPRELHQVESTDGGQTWSRPRPTGIAGYPAHLTLLPGGRILCVYGHRRPDYAIHAVLSHDEGRSWEVPDTRVVRGGLPSRDLGYPASTVTTAGDVFTVYYCQDNGGVTGIEATTYRI